MRPLQEILKTKPARLKARRTDPFNPTLSTRIPLKPALSELMQVSQSLPNSPEFRIALQPTVKVPLLVTQPLSAQSKARQSEPSNPTLSTRMPLRPALSELMQVSQEFPSSLVPPLVTQSLLLRPRDNPILMSTEISFIQNPG